MSRLQELINGERQVVANVEDARRDHRARYEWVAERLPADARVLDAGCGVGYGSSILATSGATVTAFDKSEAAIDFAKARFNHNPNIKYLQTDAYSVDQAMVGTGYDAVVAFEVLEHLARPELALSRWGMLSNRLYCSVPNEDEFPFRGKIRHHMRHYTRDEFAGLLRGAGWEVVEWWGQEGTESEVEPEVNGRTLVAVCDRVDIVELPPEPEPDAELERYLLRSQTDGKLLRPKSVAIVAMGSSSHAWAMEAARHGGRWRLAHECWVINNLGGVLGHDRVFHMDDFRIQEARVDAKEAQAIDGMLFWMRQHPGPIYTSRAYPDYPGSADYPLEWVLNRVGVDHYFTGTLAYAIAFAIALGCVEELQVYGADFHYENPIKREQGRACVEFWLGVAEARGIAVSVPSTTTLFDSRWGGRDVLYGYDTEHVRVEETNGRYRVSRVERRPEDVPTAEEMAARYSHNPQKDGR